MKQQFDLFGTGEAREPEVKAQSPSTRDVRGIGDEIDMIRRLEETGRYRVLRKLQPRTIAGPRHGFIEPDIGVELLCQFGIGIMTEAFALRPIDHADKAFQSLGGERLGYFGLVGEIEEEAGLSQ